MFSLRCDYRENRGRCVIDLLRGLRATNAIISADKYALSEEVMTTGDYSIQCAGHIILIERKTWEDLAASIKDKRIFNNHKKMLDARALGFRIIYLIEGRAPSPENAATKVSGIPMGNMISKLDHFAMRDGVWVEYTRGASHTAQRLLELGKHLMTLSSPTDSEPLDTSAAAPPISAVLHENKASDASGAIAAGGASEAKNEVNGADLAMRPVMDPDATIKKKYVRDTCVVRENMLTRIPGIGDKTARSIMARYAFPDVMAPSASTAGLSAFQTSEIKELIEGRRPDILVAMLSEIKGVSPTVARVVAASFGVGRLRIRDAATMKDLADLKLGATRRIGPALAARICETWSDPPQSPPLSDQPAAAPPVSLPAS